MVSAPVLSEPLRARAPANVPPVPVHDVALVELQVNIEEAPLSTAVGFAANVAVGFGTMVTVAVAGVLAPPIPEQVSEYVVVAVSAPVVCEPLVGCAPANVPPVIVQEVALVELQVNVEDPPLAIDVGLAVSVATGLGTMVTVAVAGVLVPPAPVQVRVNVVLAVKAPVL